MSPELNPRDNIWDKFKFKIRQRTLIDLQELKLVAIIDI